MLGKEVRVMNAKANYIDENVQELREKLYLAAKKSKTRRFHALFDKVYRMDFLTSAWNQVKANKGSAGIDNERIEDIIAIGKEVVLTEIQYRLKNKKYYPKKVKRVYIPKPDGRQRPLGIPTVRDRIVQASTKLVIELIFEADFLDCSYGFRPNRCAHDAVDEIRKTMNAGYTIVLDADIKGFFDNINHDMLLDLVYQRINDRKVLKYIKKWLKCGVMDSGTVLESSKGTPQGGVISPLLANIYLHEFDKFWTQQTTVTGKLVRYADDFVILFRTEKEAEIGLQLAKEKLRELNLELNENKTRIVLTKQGKEGFDFLGFQLSKVRSPKYKKYYAQNWPSNKSMNAIKTKIKDFLGQRKILIWNMDNVIKELNPILRGWMNYFKCGNSTRKFSQVDRYVHERMALWWRKKHNKNQAKWYKYMPWEKFKNCGVQILSGNIVYRSRYSKA
jgi:group II intron reverse transcriptase/maturase